MLTSIRSSSVLSAALALASGANAYADNDPDHLDQCGSDWKRYPATFCGSNKPGSIVSTQDGKAVNPSTTTTYEITCPLIQDRLTSLPFDDEGWPTSTQFEQVYIWVSKKSSANIPCYLRGRDPHSESGYTQTYTLTGSSSSNDYLVIFSYIPANYNTTIGCKIPKATGSSASTRSGITSYTAHETGVDYDWMLCEN